jgi:outer membrane lipoprotein-sorting protein
MARRNAFQILNFFEKCKIYKISSLHYNLKNYKGGFVMKRIIKVVPILLGSVLLAVSATIPKDIVSLLDKIDTANAKYKTAKASFDFLTKFEGGTYSQKGEMLIDNTTRKFKANEGTTTYIYDGNYLWVYFPEKKLYSKRRLSPDDVQRSLFDLMPVSIALSPICKKTFTDKDFLSTLGKSSLSKTTFQNREAFLLSFTTKKEEMATKIYVDAKDYKVLQISMVLTGKNFEVLWKINSLQTNLSFPKGTFSFSPPAGAKEFVPSKGKEPGR